MPRSLPTLHATETFPSPYDSCTDTVRIAASLDGWLRAAAPASLAVAFSGGLDSRFLAHMALRARRSGRGPEVVLFHIAGPHVPSAERALAEDWARTRGLELVLVPINPLDDEAVRANGRLRCYHCKRRLFSRLFECARRRFGSAPFLVCDGTNASDLLAYRPGLKALAELGVSSPLALAGFSKEMIRRHAAATGMDRPDQPARPCLLTRFAYDLPLDASLLAAVEAAEEAVARLLRQNAVTAASSRDVADSSGRAGSPESVPSPAHPPDFRLRLAPSAPCAAQGATQGAAQGYMPENGRADAVHPASPERPLLVELHLARPAPPGLEEALIAAVRAAGLPSPAIQVPESLSGHFDRA